jgi:hypothetical protein
VILQYTPILEHNIDIPSNNLSETELASSELVVTLPIAEKYPFKRPITKSSGAIKASDLMKPSV